MDEHISPIRPLPTAAHQGAHHHDQQCASHAPSVCADTVAAANAETVWQTPWTRRALKDLAMTPVLLTAMGSAVGQGTARVPRISILLLTHDDEIINPLLEGLGAFGYIDGKTVTVTYRFAEGRIERAQELAAELAQSDSDVIFAFSGELAPILKAATPTIPIVVATSNDPVQSGLVASYNHPGGNITGVTFASEEVAAKRLQLLHEAVPAVTRVAILWNPNHADPDFRETSRAARQLGIELQSLEVRGPDDFSGALDAAVRGRSEALIVVWSRLTALRRRLIGEFAAKNRIILVGSVKFWTTVGALFTYGPSLANEVRLCATYIDRIIKGTRPADLPIERPTRFEFIVNIPAANSLGITMPPLIIARADQVIE